MARTMGGNNERSNNYKFFSSVEGRLVVKNKIIKLILK
jgi:hypothetical protein